MAQSLLPDMLPDLILDRPLRQFPSLISSLFNGDLMSSDFMNRGARIYEEDNKLHVEVPLPGLNSDEIEVSLNKGVLIVHGESKKEEKDKKRKFYRSSERKYSYSIALPSQIDDKQEPKASYQDGILNVSLQLAKQAETRKIKVNSNKNSKAKK